MDTVSGKMRTKSKSNSSDRFRMCSFADKVLAIDLFSGAGGLGEGLEAAGIRVAISQEYHPQPALTNAFNHPDTTVMVGDIRKLDLSLMAEILQWRFQAKTVDIVVGGPPCQGFSSAGKKVLRDPRNDLFLNFYQVVKRFHPTMFLLENVPGFKKMYGGAVCEEAKRLFVSIGYDLTDEILNACEYGVPQRRQRFVVVGVKKRESSARFLDKWYL